MLEKHSIQSRGFNNVLEEGNVVGFQVPIRLNYYRGVWLSMLRPATLTADGEIFEGDQITWTINGTTYEQSELANFPDVNWNIQDLAILTVKKPGGLELGIHDIEVFFTYSASYLPPRIDLAFGKTVKKSMVLVG